jgi:hypothetical protein
VSTLFGTTNDEQRTMQILVDYIVDTLTTYAELRDNSTKKVSMRTYLNTVFIKNVDTWGFIMIYYPVVELLNNRSDQLSKSQTNILTRLRAVFIDNLFRTPAPIDTVKLIRDLNEIGTLLKRESALTDVLSE